MFVKAEGRKLYEEVVGQIKHLINTKQLKNGDLLPSEEELRKKSALAGQPCGKRCVSWS